MSIPTSPRSPALPVAGALLIAVLASGCSTTPGFARFMGAPATPARVATAAAPASEADRAFLSQAAMRAMYETDVSRLAAARATSPRVRTYAQWLANRRTQASSEMASLMRAKGVALPTSLPADKATKLQRLAALPPSATSTAGSCASWASRSARPPSPCSRSASAARPTASCGPGSTRRWPRCAASWSPPRTSPAYQAPRARNDHALAIVSVAKARTQRCAHGRFVAVAQALSYNDLQTQPTESACGTPRVNAWLVHPYGRRNLSKEISMASRIPKSSSSKSSGKSGSSSMSNSGSSDTQSERSQPARATAAASAAAPAARRNRPEARAASKRAARGPRHFGKPPTNAWPAKKRPGISVSRVRKGALAGRRATPALS